MLGITRHIQSVMFLGLLVSLGMAASFTKAEDEVDPLSFDRNI